MRRVVVQTSGFSKAIDKLIKERIPAKNDYDEFELHLVKNPKSGEVIPGLGGLRKSRLKSAKGGQRSGFRVDYLDIPEAQKLYMLAIYAKNQKSDLSSKEKKNN